MDMRTNSRGVFASRKEALALSRNKRVNAVVKSFLGRYRHIPGKLSVYCPCTKDRFTAASKRSMACFTFLASWNLGDYQFKLFLETPCGEIFEIGEELRLAAQRI